MTRYLSLSLLHPKIVRGGAQQCAYELFKGACEDDEISAHLIAATDPGLKNLNTPPGAVFTGIDGDENENIFISQNFNMNYHLQTNWFVIEKLNEYFSRNHFDWIHIHHSLLVGLDTIELIKNKLPNARIFYTLHEYLPICHADGQLKKTYNNSLCYDPCPSACAKCFPELGVDFFFLRNEIFRNKFELIDHFITPSNFCRQKFIEWGLDAEKITVIPNGQKNLNMEKKQNHIEKTGVVNFAFFGQMIDNKGAHLLIEAAKLLDQSEISSFAIHFYGGNQEFASSKYQENLKTLLDSCEPSVQERLHFYGEYTHEQLPDIYSNIDCVVVPSTWFEVFGLVVSEAWMFNKPIIASNIGGLSERISEGKNGFLFNVNDPTDLALKMRAYTMNHYNKRQAFDGITPPSERAHFWEEHKKLFSLLDKNQKNTIRAA